MWVFSVPRNFEVSEKVMFPGLVILWLTSRHGRLHFGEGLQCIHMCTGEGRNISRWLHARIPHGKKNINTDMKLYNSSR